MNNGGPFAPFASPVTVVPVTRTATVIAKITLKGLFGQISIPRGIVVEARTSYFPRRKRTWHTDVTLPDGTRAVVPTKSLRFEVA
jgi:hypothetical protein